MLAGDLVITEVMADFAAPTGSSGTDDGREWFEIFNNTDRPLSLKGLTVVHSRPDGSKSATHTMDDVTVGPGQYFTLGNATQDLVPPYVDYGYGADLGDFFNTDGGKLALKCDTSTIDEAIYDSVRSGHTRQLSSTVAPDYAANDVAENWCEATGQEFEPNNFGTPGQESDCAPVIMGACSDSGTMRPAVAPNPGDLVITEIMPDPNGTDTEREWVEIKAINSFDLNGVGMGRITDTTPDSLAALPECVPIAGGSYVVFAHNFDMSDTGNAGLPAGSVVGLFSTALPQANGDIQLSSPSGVVLDAVSWVSERAGKSLALDPDVIDTTANDDPANFCDGSATYGTGGMGTPGAANTNCVAVAPPGKCDTGGGSFRDIVKPQTGDLVITEIMANPKNEPAEEWFEITNVGSAPFDLNGLGLDRPGDTTPNKGAPAVVTLNDCTQLMPGGYAIFAKQAMNNGGITPVATFTMSLTNSTGAQLQVVDPSSCSLVDTAYVCTAIYDIATWGTTHDGQSMQLKPGSINATANDTTTNYCEAVAAQPYGTTTGNYGTPGVVNVCM
jgi:hypothetical protein